MYLHQYGLRLVPIVGDVHIQSLQCPSTCSNWISLRCESGPGEGTSRGAQGNSQPGLGVLTCQESVDVQAPVLVDGATHVHHVGVAGVVGRVGAEVHQHHPAHGKHNAPLVVGGRVGQRPADVPAVEQEREAQQCP